MNYDDFHAACKAIQEIVRKHPSGRRDDEALAAIRQHVSFLRKHLDHLAYLDEKLMGVEEHSAILYSARKHRQWDRGDTTGAELQAAWVRRAADSFSDQLREYERSGRPLPSR